MIGRGVLDGLTKAAIGTVPGGAFFSWAPAPVRPDSTVSREEQVALHSTGHRIAGKIVGGALGAVTIAALAHMPAAGEYPKLAFLAGLYCIGAGLKFGHGIGNSMAEAAEEGEATRVKRLASPDGLATA